jgi:hypothetical protein
VIVGIELLALKEFLLILHNNLIQSDSSYLSQMELKDVYSILFDNQALSLPEDSLKQVQDCYAFLKEFAHE